MRHDYKLLGLILGLLSLMAVARVHAGVDEAVPQRAPAVPGQMSEEQVAAFVVTMTRLHQMETRLREQYLSVDKARQVARENLAAMRAEPARAGGPGELTFRGYRLRLLKFVEERDEASELARELAVTQAWASEGIHVLSMLASLRGEQEKLHRYGVLWVELFPLSPLRKSVDLSMNVVPAGSGFVDIQVPMIPMVRRVQLQEIAELWERSGQHHTAVLAYREAIYCEGRLRFDRTMMHDGWLSVTTAPLWLRVAENDWRTGRQSEAFESLAKAMVFGNPRQFEEGKQLAQRLARPAEQPAAKPARLEAKTLLRIIELYREMNTHPRALQLLDEHAEVFGERLEAIRKEVAAEWLERVGGHLASYFPTKDAEIYLYGHNVFPKENRLKVTIPPPLRKEVIEKIPDAIKQVEQP